MKKKLLVAMSALTLVSCSPKEKSQEITNSTTMENVMQDPIDNKSIDSPDPIHNSQNSVDWNGTYEGTTPCASCSGIKTLITLNEDNTFNIKEEYIGNNTYDEKGTFQWDSTGNIITLMRNGGNQKYMVGENQLIFLDVEGKKVEGPRKELYILKKK